jgi:DNA/RNA non-specific endonuclease
MDLTTEELQRAAIRIWIRTGVLLKIPSPEPSEEKYNHRHDPANGRFTFRGTGVHDGTPSVRKPQPARGGSFGGAGASGSWDKQPGSKPPPPVLDSPSAVFITTSPTRVRDDVPASKPTPKPVRPLPPVAHPKPATEKIVLNGYSFHIDAAKRLRKVEGLLALGQTQPRSRSAQRDAGKPDRRSTDDGGHYIARRFNGPTAAINHFAQDLNLNRGRYRVLEDEWARRKREGKTVYVIIRPLYLGDSKRPVGIIVIFSVNGRERSVRFPNEPRGKKNVG